MAAICASFSLRSRASENSETIESETPAATRLSASLICFVFSVVVVAELLATHDEMPLIRTTTTKMMSATRMIILPSSAANLSESEPPGTRTCRELSE